MFARLTVEAVRSTTPAEALTKGAVGGSCADNSIIVVEGPPRISAGKLPRCRRITQAEVLMLPKGGKLGHDEMYVGRGG